MRRRGEVWGRAEVPGEPGAELPFAVGGALLGGGVSYRMVLCSSERRSKARKDPSAPTDTKMSVEPGNQATSYTSRS